MLNAINEKGDLKNLRVDDEGALKVTLIGALSNIKVDNDGNLKVLIDGALGNVKTDSDGNLKVSLDGVLGNITSDEEGNLNVTMNKALETTNVFDKESTISCNVYTLLPATDATNINFSNSPKITSIMVANYSETENIVVVIGEERYIIGSNIAVELPVNKTLSAVSLELESEATEEVKVQLVVKGVM